MYFSDKLMATVVKKGKRFLIKCRVKIFAILISLIFGKTIFNITLKERMESGLTNNDSDIN